MSAFDRAFSLFLSLLVEAFPFLLIGVLFSSALMLFVNERRLVSLCPRNPILGALVGSTIGFLFPVCECGNVPVARRLLAQGVPTAVAVGFLLAAPTINPVVIWSTWVAFRDQPEIVILRVVLSLVIATIVAVIFSLQTDLKYLLNPDLARLLPTSSASSASSNAANVLGSSTASRNGDQQAETPSLLRSGTYFLGASSRSLEQAVLTESREQLLAQAGLGMEVIEPNRSRISVFFENTIQELRELGGILIFGSAFVSILQTFVPREAILSIAHGTVTPIIAMLLLGALVSVCSTVDAFFALSFAASFTSSALLAFLVFGPMVDLKGMGLMLSVFRPKVVVYLFILVAQLTFLLSLLLSFYF